MSLPILSEIEQINFYSPVKSPQNHRFFDDFRETEIDQFTQIHLILNQDLATIPRSFADNVFAT